MKNKPGGDLRVCRHISIQRKNSLERLRYSPAVLSRAKTNEL